MSTGQLKVYYPHGGKKFILHWYTYDTRGHVVVANNEQQLYSIADKILDKYGVFEIKDMAEIEIVAPSEAIKTNYVRSKYNHAVLTFHNQVAYNLREVLKAGKPLPKLFDVCNKYKPEDDSDIIDEYDTNHYNCNDCIDTIRLVGITPEQLYDQYHSKWDSKFPSTPYVNKRLVFSKARQAQANEQIYFVSTSGFGHHGSGLDIRFADPNESYPAYVNSEAAFFFVKLRAIDQKIMKKKVDDRNQSEIIYEQDRVRRQEEEDRLRAEKEIEDTLSVFNE